MGGPESPLGVQLPSNSAAILILGSLHNAHAFFAYFGVLLPCVSSTIYILNNVKKTALLERAGFPNHEAQTW